MNKREKLASAILVLTLAVGTIVDLLERRADMAGPEGRIGLGPADTIGVCRPDSVPVPEGGADAGGRPDERAPAGAGEERYRKLDLNQACLEELELLPGIGPKKAKALLEWRAANGPFKSLESLLEIKGIGPGTLERLRPYATVGG